MGQKQEGEAYAWQGILPPTCDLGGMGTHCDVKKVWCSDSVLWENGTLQEAGKEAH